MALPWPEAATIEEATLAEQIAATARELPQRPLVLGGCCCAHVGAVRELARRHGRIGLVWIDAHGDLNTPESSPSGNAWGMPLRMLIDAGDVAARDVTLLGARNLDPPEADFIRRAGHPPGARRAARARLRRPRLRRVRAGQPGRVHARGRAGRPLQSLEPVLAAIPAPAGPGSPASSRRSETRRSCPGSPMRSASDGAACNRSVTGWGLSSRHVRGPDRRPGRAQERSTA